MKTLNVGLIGLGTVGSGVAQILIEHSDRVARHAGCPLHLTQVVVKDKSKPRQCELPASIVSEDLSSIVDNPDIAVVAQLIGGLEPARTIMMQLLKAGKDVVTANKALLAEHGPELFELARKLGRSIAFEASVAGGIPIIANISQCLSGNQIQSLSGILNGTSNFIVSQMEEKGQLYDKAVAEAQDRGYAEADPTMDVDGTDAVQKLAILAHLAFGARVDWRDIPRTGIQSLDSVDMQFASELGYRIKLLAMAELTPEGLELHASPPLVRRGTPLGEVRGAYNAISVVGDAVGDVFFHGLGAGQMPTASAVMADMIDTAVGRTRLTFQTLDLWSQESSRVELSDPDLVAARYYLRLAVDDDPGVLAEIAGVLAQQKISIASVIQHEPSTESKSPGVPLVIITHTATEGAMRSADQSIQNLDSVRGEMIKMRILD